MNQFYPNLFTPIRVGGITLKNRIAMSAMDTHMFAMDGTLTPKACAHYLERARGGVGLIFTEISPFTWPGGKSGRREPRFNSPLVTTEWADLIETVHSFGTKICVQLNHAGFISTPDFCDGRETLTPYVVPGVTTSAAHLEHAREITEADFADMRTELRKCLNNIRDCGFDGIEFHAGHDYLFNIFLSPATNKRTDAYGGSVENRARFLCECVAMAREVLGPEKIISVKLAVCEEIEDGITLEMGAEYAKLCEAAGANIINCTIGQGPDGSATEAEFLPDGRRVHYGEYIKPRMTTAKTGIIGKLRDPDMCEEILATGKADIIFLARALLADPAWAMKAEMGRKEQIRKCISCRKGCFGALRPRGARIRCVINPYLGFEDQATERCPGRTSVSRKILVAGGGVAGMQAAIIARKRGHDVTIVEKTDTLGGQMILAGLPPHKSVVHEVLAWFRGEVARLNIPVVYNTAVDEAYIDACKPDVVLLAFGAQPFRPNIEGMEQAQDAWDLLRNQDSIPAGKKALIIGGGTVGCEVAETILAKGGKVAIVEMDDGLNKKQDKVHRDYIHQLFADHRVEIHLNSTVRKITEGTVTVLGSRGETAVQADYTVCAVGQRPVRDLTVTDIRSKGIDCYLLGDANGIGDFQTATRSAMDVVMTLG